MALGALVIPAGVAEAVRLSIEPGAAVIEAATPDGSVALFSLASEAAGYSRTVARRAEVHAVGADGAVVVELESAPVPTSVWAAIDLETGAFALATPVDSRAEQVPPPATEVTVGETTLAVPGRALEAWLVRPGSEPGRGAWLAALGDGAAGDLDGAFDGVLQFGPDGFVPVDPERGTGFGPAPASWAAGDVLVAVDPETLDHWVVVVGGSRTAGEGVSR